MKDDGSGGRGRSSGQRDNESFTARLPYSPTPVAEVLPFLLAELEEAGIRRSGVDSLLRKYPGGKIAVVLRSELTFSGG